MKLIRIFFTGMLISFLGTLPLGTLNVSAMQLSISDGIRPAVYFALGASLVEIAYVRLSLVAMDWILRRKKLLKFLEWFTLLIIVALAISSFYVALHPATHKNPILSKTLHRFWLGFTMSLVNPLQIPFWFGWSTVLFTRKVLLPRPDFYNSYILGIGLGTLLGFSVFIFSGRLLVNQLNAGQAVIHWIIGGVFSITAILLLVKMVRHKDPISKMKDIG